MPFMKVKLSVSKTLNLFHNYVCCYTKKELKTCDILFDTWMYQHSDNGRYRGNQYLYIFNVL